MSAKQININYDKLLEIASRGVVRATVFLGLGLNAASNPNFNDYSLTNVAPIQLVPNNLDSKTIKGFKEDFSLWIVTCGIRELIETFNIFLDEIFRISLLIAASKKDIMNEEAGRFLRQFTNRGTDKKFEMLDHLFGITYDYSDHVCTINRTRNCLTHRQGIVASRDCNDDKNLLIKWLGVELFTESKTGKIVKAKLPLLEPFRCEARSSLKIRNIEKKISFHLGDLVKIPPESLAEMCVFLSMAAKTVNKAAVDYADRKGIIDKENGNTY